MSLSEHTTHLNVLDERRTPAGPMTKWVPVRRSNENWILSKLEATHRGEEGALPNGQSGHERRHPDELST